MHKTVNIGIFLILNIFVLSGCSRLKFIDQKIGEIFFSSSSSPEFIREEMIDSKSLNKKQKDKIEFWLKEHDLNRYGDSLKTYYASGTPLFNVAGKALERYEYILNNHPEIFNN